MAVAAKFGTASDAERSLVFLTIINDLGLGCYFHLDEFELVVDDREELRDFVHIRACALGRRNSLGNRSPDIDGDGQNLDAGGNRIARSLDNFSAYKPKPTPTHTN